MPYYQGFTGLFMQKNAVSTPLQWRTITKSTNINGVICFSFFCNSIKHLIVYYITNIIKYQLVILYKVNNAFALNISKKVASHNLIKINEYERKIIQHENKKNHLQVSSCRKKSGGKSYYILNDDYASLEILTTINNCTLKEIVKERNDD